MSDRILFVDDDLEMRSLLHKALTEHDLQVDSFGTPDEAVAALRAGTYDAVLMNLNLQSASGLELCRQITQHYPEVPLVAMAASAQAEAAAGAIRAGAYDLVAKPVQPDALALALHRAAQFKLLQLELNRLRHEAGGSDLEDANDEGTAGGLLSMDEMERRHILHVLRAVHGNKTLAAQVLGLDRRTLYRRLERYGEAGRPVLHAESAAERMRSHEVQSAPAT